MIKEYQELKVMLAAYQTAVSFGEDSDMKDGLTTFLSAIEAGADILNYLAESDVDMPDLEDTEALEKFVQKHASACVPIINEHLVSTRLLLTY